MLAVFALAEGLSNKDVGRRLNLSEGTVKVHLHNIYSKLGVKNRTALVVLAHTELASLARFLILRTLNSKGLTRNSPKRPRSPTTPGNPGSAQGGWAS